MSTKKKNTVRKKTVKRKPKRRIRWGVVLAPFVLVALIVLLVKLPGMMTNSKLKKLGYAEEEITAIKEAELTDTILKGQYYSRTLADAIVKGTLRKGYIPLYVTIDDAKKLTDRYFLLYARLEDMGYEEDQLLNLFRSLEFNEITPLLVSDYQWDENVYIADMAEVRSGSFDVPFDEYHTSYKDAREVTDPSETTVLVNKTWYLPADYVPGNLTGVSTEYAVDGMRMTKGAANAVVDMCMAGINSGNAFFVAGSYQTYETIQKSYDYFVKTEGERSADLMVGKPGFNEFQTGLACTFAATYEEYEDFRTTDCFKWLQANSYKFGFVERAPLKKEWITGLEEDATYFRYVGKELAGQIYRSRLTFDEYWNLVLKDWDHEDVKPSDQIIENAAAEFAGN
ncbi:MAG: M15 family metallopeptidase [Erysipelotrichaceae bacterium]|nr:M15 family metallopeptidase [Erysipelotrichaceae bacterium]